MRRHLEILILRGKPIGNIEVVWWVPVNGKCNKSVHGTKINTYLELLKSSQNTFMSFKGKSEMSYREVPCTDNCTYSLSGRTLPILQKIGRERNGEDQVTEWGPSKELKY